MLYPYSEEKHHITSLILILHSVLSGSFFLELSLYPSTEENNNPRLPSINNHQTSSYPLERDPSKKQNPPRAIGKSPLPGVSHQHSPKFPPLPRKFISRDARQDWLKVRIGRLIKVLTAGRARYFPGHRLAPLSKDECVCVLLLLPARAARRLRNFLRFSRCATIRRFRTGH